MRYLFIFATLFTFHIAKAEKIHCADKSNHFIFGATIKGPTSLTGVTLLEGIYSSLSATSMSLIKSRDDRFYRLQIERGHVKMNGEFTLFIDKNFLSAKSFKVYLDQIGINSQRFMRTLDCEKIKN